MRARITKWGNSLGLRIPRAIAEEIRIAEGSTVELSFEDGRLIVRPVTAPALSLAELLADVTEDNRHAEVDTGATAGDEAW